MYIYPFISNPNQCHITAQTFGPCIAFSKSIFMFFSKNKANVEQSVHKGIYHNTTIML